LVLFVGSLALLGSFIGAGASLADARPDTQGARASLHVEVDGRLVTVLASAVPIRDVVEEIALQNSLVVVSRDPLVDLVTLELRRVPLSKAIARVLHDHSFTLQTVQPTSIITNTDARYGRLWVFSAAAGQDESASFAFNAPDAYRDIMRWSHALTDGDADIRLEAVDKLATHHSDQSASALAAAALSHSDSLVREEAVFALGEHGDDSGIHVLRQALLDPDANVRQAAVDAFTEIGGDESASALAIVLHDDDVSLREEVVYALGEIGGTTAVSLLAQAQADPESHIQAAATELLDQLSD
jgi:hypothetical protein